MKIKKYIKYQGNIQRNWLCDFPKNLLTNKNTYHELFIGECKLVLLIDLTLLKHSSNEFSLPVILYESYDCTIDWGDGIIENISSANIDKITHTYEHINASDSYYKIKISGKFPGFNNYTYEQQYNKNAWEALVRIDDWGILDLPNLNYRIL